MGQFTSLSFPEKQRSFITILYLLDQQMGVGSLRAASPVSFLHGVDDEVSRAMQSVNGQLWVGRQAYIIIGWMIAQSNAMPRRRKHSQTIILHLYLSSPSRDHHFSLPQLVPQTTSTLPHGYLSAEPTIAHQESAPPLESLPNVCSILGFEGGLGGSVEEACAEGDYQVANQNDWQEQWFTRCSE